MPIKRTHKKRNIIIIIVVLVIAAIVTGVVVHHYRSDSKKNVDTTAPKPITDKTGTGPTTSKPNTATTQTTPTPTPSTTPATPTPTSTATLIYPFGTFVSDHSPNLGGSPHPNIETSNCNTTAGASCYIKFTQGATTRALAAKTADSSGTINWPQWSLQQLQLTAGQWTITAVATLGTQTLSRQDPTALTVSP